MTPAEASHDRSGPHSLTSFVGHEEDMVRLLHLLTIQPAVRLLTLTGAPGIGKTRLAQHLLPQCQAAFPDGITFVPLAPLDAPALILPTVAHALALPNRESEDWEVLLVRVLRTRHQLLVLDNFEHVLSAALSIVDVLEQCPTLTVLVTSRTALHVRGEQIYEIPPLALPPSDKALTPAAVATASAIQLFVQRAQRVNADFQVTQDNLDDIVEICRYLAGLPLAIELAAVHTTIWSPHALLSRFSRVTALATLNHGPHDLPLRQQTMQATIDWSYALLTPTQQMTLRTLSICRGGWSLATAAALMPTIMDPFTVLLALVEAHLVTVKEMGDELRFDLLPVIQEYGLMHLATQGEREIAQQRHVQYFLALAEQVAPTILGVELPQGAKMLDQESANLREALRWCLIAGEATLGLRIATALWRYWQLRGKAPEGVDWFVQMLSLDTTAVAPQLMAWACYSAGELALHVGRYERAEYWAAQALSRFHEAGEHRGIADALALSASAAAASGDYGQALRLDEAGLALSRELDDHRGIARSLNNLGFDACQRGDYPQALAWYEEAVAFQRQLGDGVALVRSLTNSGDVLSLLGRYEEGRACCYEAFTLSQEMNSVLGTSLALSNLGNIAFRVGDVTEAKRAFMECLALATQMGDEAGKALMQMNLGIIATSSGAYKEAQILLREARERYQMLGKQRMVARTMVVLGDVLLLNGRLPEAMAMYLDTLMLLGEDAPIVELITPVEGLAQAAQELRLARHATVLLGSTQRAREQEQMPLTTEQEGNITGVLEQTRTQLGEEAFALAWETGQSEGLATWLKSRIMDDLHRVACGEVTTQMLLGHQQEASTDGNARTL